MCSASKSKILKYIPFFRNLNSLSIEQLFWVLSIFSYSGLVETQLCSTENRSPTVFCLRIENDRARVAIKTVNFLDFQLRDALYCRFGAAIIKSLY